MRRAVRQATLALGVRVLARRVALAGRPRRRERIHARRRIAKRERRGVRRKRRHGERRRRKGRGWPERWRLLHLIEQRVMRLRRGSPAKGLRRRLVVSAEQGRHRLVVLRLELQCDPLRARIESNALSKRPLLIKRRGFA